MVHLLFRLIGLTICCGWCFTTPSVAVAVSTIDCHCFQDRQFRSDQPRAFDPYLLATVQNRLMAHTYNLPRKEIVSFKMSGVPNARIWIACRIAENNGSSPAEMLALHEQLASWSTLIRVVGVDPETLGSSFLAALMRQGTVEEDAAWQLIAETLKSNFEVSTLDLTQLRRKGTTEQEAILVTVLADVTREPVLALAAEQDAEGSWGMLLVKVGVTLDQIEAQIARRLDGTGR